MLLAGTLVLPGTVFSASSVRINEVAPSRSTAQGGDWVELFIATNSNLSGWMLKFTAGTSEITVTLPSIASGSFAGSEFVMVRLATTAAVSANETTGTGDTNSNGFWDVYVSSTALGTTAGMVNTDNVLVLYDASTAPVDALVFADNSGSFTTSGGRGTRYDLAVASGQWTGPASSGASAAKIQNAAVNLNSTGTGIFIGRSGSTDTDAAGFAKNDWGLFTVATQGTANATTPDPSAPSAIPDLAVSASATDSLTLQWTAAGDDAGAGAAASYVVRYATTSMTTHAHYFEATDYTNTIASVTAGTLTGLTVGSLSPGTTYWFLVVGQDDGDSANGNFKLGDLPTNRPVSGLTSPDAQAPDAVADLAATLASQAAASVSLTWSAPAEQPGGGAAAAYALRFASFSVAAAGGDAAWWSAATDVTGEPAPAAPTTAQSLTVSGLPSGTSVYFHLRSRDALNLSNNDSGAEQMVYIPAHLLISQAKSSSTATSRFVELYNPTTYTIDLANPQIYLHRRTATGGTDNNQALTGSIPTRGFHLIARSTEASGGLSLDTTWTADTTLFTTDNALYLSLSATAATSPLDVLAFGSGTDAAFIDFGDANAPARLTLPSNGTAATRSPAGGGGHATDTNKWQSDFLNDQAPSPRNSSSGTEPDLAAPAAVSNLTALGGSNDGEVALSWTSPGDDGASGNITGGQFVIKFSTVQIINAANFDAPAFAVSTVTLSTNAVAGSAQSYALTGLNPGTTYWFAIKTRDESSFSVWNSSADNPAVNTLAVAPAQDLVPGSPQSVQVTSRGQSFIALSWTAPSPDPGDIASYELHYGTASGVYTGTSTVGGLDSPVNVGTVTSYVLTGLAVSTTYYLALKTVDGLPTALSSAFSSEVSTYTTFAPPGAPASFAGTAQSTGSIHWDWTLVAGATAYQLQTSTGGLVVSLADPATFYVETGLGPDAASAIAQVQAFNAAGGGGTTADPAAPVYTLAQPPVSAAYLAVTSTTIQLSWGENGNPSATDYEVSLSTNGSATIPFAAGLTSPPTTLASLSAGTSYDIRVRAQNRDGVATSFLVFPTTVTVAPPLSGVVINEVMYNPFGTDSAHEWIELYNSAASSVDLSSWTMFDGSNWLSLTFVQGGSVVPAGGFAVLHGNPTNLFADYAAFSGSSTWIVADIGGSPSFSNADTVAVRDASNFEQSSVTYSNTTPWPAPAEGQTIERVNPAGADSDPANWAAGPSSGTPGAINNTQPDLTAPNAISDLTALAGAADGEVSLSWTAPGDDGALSNISGGQFVIVYSTAGIINNINSPPSPSGSLTISTSVAAGSAQARTLTGLTPGANYWFAIKTADEANNFSSWTSSATDPSVNTLAFAAAGDAAPSPPVIGAVTSFNRALSFPFSAPSPDPGDIAGYAVYSATYVFASTSAPNVAVANYANTLSGHGSVGLVNGLTYYFRMNATDAGPNFLTSALTAASSGVPRIRAPATLAATHLGSSVDLLWSASGDVGDANFGGYNLYRSTASGGPYALLASLLTGTTYQDVSGVSAAQSFYYVIRTTDTDPATLSGFSESANSFEAAALSDVSAPEIAHSPVGFLVFSGAGVSLAASVSDFTDVGKTVAGTVQSATLFVRVAGQSGAYTPIAFSGTGLGTGSATLTAAVPASFLQSAAAAGGFTYYLSATDGANTTLFPPAPAVRSVTVDAGASVVIGRSGGTVSSQGGFVEVEISTNALGGDTQITVLPLDVSALTTGGAEDSIATGAGYGGRPLGAGQFGPAGTRFAAPVTIRLRYLDLDGDGYPELPPGGQNLEVPNSPEFHADRLKVYLFSGGRWVLVGGRRSGERVSVQTRHFSTYALFPAGVSAARAAERFLTPNGDGVNDAATFGLDALNVTVYDASGREVWSGGGDGATAVQWPASDKGGSTVESGTYIYRAEGPGGRTHGVIVVVK